MKFDHGFETKQADFAPTHHAPQNWRDRFAFRLVKMVRVVSDAVFAKRYGHRAVMLETVAALPEMVGRVLLQFKPLRDDQGWIKKRIEDADHARMHLIAFIEIAQPNTFERLVIMVVQLVFLIVYVFLCLLAPGIARRVVNCLDAEAVTSYGLYLAEIDAGRIENTPAPQIAKAYWTLSDDAGLRDVVAVIRQGKVGYRDHHVAE